METPMGRQVLLAIDSGSPLVSIACGTSGEVLASRSMAISHSSEALLRGIDEALGEAGLRVGDLHGLVGLRGPGSFTGLRVGLATLLGLHQALDVPATALPTLEVLGLTAPAGPEPVAAVVNALRGDWFVQLFADGESLDPAETIPAAEVGATGARRVIGHQLDELSSALPGGVTTIEAGELAPLALRMVAERDVEWSAATLLDPLYLRPPAIHGQA